MPYRLFQLILVSFGILLSVAVVVPSWLFSLSSTQAIHLGGVRIDLVPLITASFILAMWAGRHARKHPGA